MIPCLYLLFGGDGLPNRKIQFVERVKNFATRQIWLVCLGFGIGLFLGHPMLFLDPSSVTRVITGQTLRYASLHEFSRGQLINLSVPWRYVTYVIPFAMYPILWLVPYCAILYVVFRRSLYSLSVPILIFSLLYLYFMGKGYLGPYFGRITMLLFPGFCVLTGIVLGNLQLELREKRTLAVVSTIALLLVVGPSLLFDVAYGRALEQKDARQVVREDLQKLIGQAPTTIGVWRLPSYFYTVMPAAKVPGHWLSSFVENGLLAAPLPKCSRDEASSTQSPPRPVKSFDANTRAFARRDIRLISICPLPRRSIRLQPKRLMLPSWDMTRPRRRRSSAIPVAGSPRRHWRHSSSACCPTCRDS